MPEIFPLNDKWLWVAGHGGMAGVPRLAPQPMREDALLTGPL